MNDEEFTLFWNGPLSQWEPSVFVVDGVEYNCCEQYMMAQKAKLFGDAEAYDLIMESDSPRQQKKYGRMVQGFDDEIWNEDEENGRPRCWNIVWRGNMAKFSQNPHLFQELMETKGTTLVEASPFDKKWGIGLRASHPDAKFREGWRGKNWLGEVITNVRAFLEVDARVYDTVEDERIPY